LNRHYIMKEREREAISEQLRKLYVGLTRAKEKLIVTGVISHAVNKKTNEVTTFDFTNVDIVDEEYIIKCNSYSKMLAPIIKKCKNGAWKYYQIPFEKKQSEDESFSDDVSDVEVSDEVRNGIFELLDKYGSIKEPPSVISKVTVSQLKGDSGYSAKLQRLPVFMAAAETKGAAFGTAVHEVMEKLRIQSNMTHEYIRSEVERICPDGGEAVYSCVLGFFESELGKRASESTAMREMPFETAIPAMDTSGNEIPGETMLLQGVIDMYFESDEKLVLVDYKTDKCSSADELVDIYKVQLKWYKYAMEKLLRKEVSEVYIYSFHLGVAIEISDRLI